MFGYATDETEECMPLTVMLAHRLNARMAELRRSGQLPWLRPDSKTQVSPCSRPLAGLQKCTSNRPLPLDSGHMLRSKCSVWALRELLNLKRTIYLKNLWLLINLFFSPLTPQYFSIKKF